MKSIITIALLALSAQAVADEYVNGYFRQDGTYVQPYVRSSPPRVNYFPQLQFNAPSIKSPLEIEQGYQQIEQLRLQNRLLQQELESR